MPAFTHTFAFRPTWAPQQMVVTGTFDNWAQSVRMQRREVPGGHPVWVAKVPLECGKRVEYKYVVDGQWMPDESLPADTDGSGNRNNFVEVPASPTAQMNPRFVQRELLVMAGEIKPAAAKPTPAPAPAPAPMSRGKSEKDVEPVAAQQIRPTPSAEPNKPASKSVSRQESMTTNGFGIPAAKALSPETAEAVQGRSRASTVDSAASGGDSPEREGHPKDWSATAKKAGKGKKKGKKAGVAH